MLFKDFNFLNNAITDNQRNFIEEFSGRFEHCDFPSIDTDKVKITNEIDKKDTYLNVSLPHKTEKGFNLSIAMNDKEIIVFFANSHNHFEQFSDGDEWIKEAVNFISLMLQGRFEVQTFYRDNKIFKEKIFYINDNGEQELISSTGYFNIAFFNPFIKVRQEVKRISFIESN